MATNALSRVRSLRAAPNLTRPSSSATTTSVTSHSNGISKPVLGNTQGPSSLSLFLKNIRLLELDTLDDWPDITAATFATGGTTGSRDAQGLKKRVWAVEWALFRLFEIFNPEETRTKLKPFFPPLEQVQSINLRAALLRCLENAKKNGVLGKDTILRKTMLDECRGERMEEVLGSFSTAVLKMVINEDLAATGEQVTPLLRLCLETRGYKDDKTDLTVLGIALKRELSSVIRRRKEAETRYRDFEGLLGVKERGLRRRKEEVKERTAVKGRTAVGKDVRAEMEYLVRNNWAGNERWMEALLYGDSAPASTTNGNGHGVFGMEFERVWRRVEGNRLGELEDGDVGLLEQLEKRVKVHQERLEHWEGLRQRLSRGRQSKQRDAKKKDDQQKARESGIDFGFGAHEELQLGRVKPHTNGLGTKQPKLSGGYARLMQDFENDLQESSETKSSGPMDFLFNRHAPIRASRRPAPPSPVEMEIVSDVSELEDESMETPVEEEPVVSPTKVTGMPRRLPVRPKLDYSRNTRAVPDEDDLPTTQIPAKANPLRNRPKLSHLRSVSTPDELSDEGERTSSKPTALRRDVSASNTQSERTASTDKATEMQFTGRYPRPKLSQMRIASSDKTSDDEPPIVKRTRTLSGARARAGTYSQSQSRPASMEMKSPPQFQDVSFEEPSPLPSEDPEEEPPLSPTQNLADEILLNMQNASPSPTKPKPRHRLSLADRTRMSMSRAPALFTEDDEDDSSLPCTFAATTPLSEDSEDATMTAIPPFIEPTPAEDLASRTRKSMAGFEKARQKAQLDRRRSQRQSRLLPPARPSSWFGAVDEEGEEGDEGADEGREGRGKMLAEALMAEEEDMEKVFKSRPRIAASPAPSPSRAWNGHSDV